MEEDARREPKTWLVSNLQCKLKKEKSKVRVGVSIGFDVPVVELT
jgi:hypothetical protein